MEIAYVLVTSEIAHEMDVMRELLKLDFVKEAKGTFGVYDIFVKIEANSSKEIEDIVTKQIRKTKYVLSTTTLPIIPEQD
ncbi:MAG: Lrp/AsnC ligand binding domain-containing protein [Thaumarchaeota archaeon]|nr:Lrp/AsnC ligand binding domain-containing protein [Nitrososphaerota archaeon]